MTVGYYNCLSNWAPAFAGVVVGAVMCVVKMCHVRAFMPASLFLVPPRRRGARVAGAALLGPGLPRSRENRKGGRANQAHRPLTPPRKSNRTRSNFAVQRNGAVALGVQG